MVNYVDHLASLREIGLLVNEPNSINVWLWFKWMKNLCSYSLPFGLSHGTRRTNLSPQDQAKYKLSSDQAHVHVSSPGLCALVSPFTGFSSSTTPTSSTNKIKLTSAWTKKITWSDMYHEKKINPKSNSFSQQLKNLLFLAMVTHVSSVQNFHSWDLDQCKEQFSFILRYLSFHTYAIHSDCLSIWWLLLK